jgi:hypothetical protein
MPNAAAAGWFQDIAPCDLPAENRRVEIHRPIDVQRCQTEMMHSFAFHPGFSSDEVLPRSLSLNCIGGKAMGRDIAAHTLYGGKLRKIGHVIAFGLPVRGIAD